MSQAHTLDELATLAGLSKRTVRYYIQRGLLDRPDGRTRAATYSSAHLERLLEIARWQRAGLSLERIAELLEKPDPGTLGPARPKPGAISVWSRVQVREGIELHIEPTAAGLTPEEVRGFVRGVMALAENAKWTGDVRDG